MTVPRGSGDGSLQHPEREKAPRWLLGIAPLVVAGAVVALFLALNGPGLGGREVPPVEELAVERTILRGGEIKLVVRNDGPDPVSVRQISVNDAYVQFTADRQSVGRLGRAVFKLDYAWIEGEAYEIVLLTETGATIAHEIEVATETPVTDSGFLALMALLGLYVGVIPVSIGMLWLPFVRRVGAVWIRFLMAVTIGLLVFLALDAGIESIELAGEGPQVFGGVLLALLGAALAYLTLAAVDTQIRKKQVDGSTLDGTYLAFLVALGIGVHNLGEGLAIGAAYTVGAISLGAFLVVGFAIHNTTEGLAIVAPLAGRRAQITKLAGLGVLAGAPAILGAWIGSVATNTNLSALLIGAGVGAIVAVVQQLAPTVRDERGRRLNPLSSTGICLGLALLYLTSLLVSV